MATSDPATSGRSAKPTILHIEDNPETKRVIRRILELSGYEVVNAEDGLSGIRMAREIGPDLIIMDLNLPGIDGYEAATMIKGMAECRDIPIVALSGMVMHEDRDRSLVAGCDGFIAKPVDSKVLIGKIEEFLGGKVERLPDQDESNSLRKYNQRLVERLEGNILELMAKNEQLHQYTLQMEEVYIGIITALQKAIEQKHSYTAGHSERVTYYCGEIADEMRLPEDEKTVLRRAARLHDIGKLVIEVSSIDKPGKLEAEEWDFMKRHPEIGASILKPLKFLGEEIAVIKDHHERLDGSGYPNHKTGDEISLLASILAVADCFDAMTSTRPYRVRIQEQEALDSLKQDSGKKFRADVVEAFLRARQRSK